MPANALSTRACTIAFCSSALQHRRRVRVEGVQRVVPEHRADDARELHRAPLGGAQRVEPRLQHAGQGAGDPGDAQPLVEHAPALALDQDHAVVDQHLDQLFGVERVAFGLLLDQRAQGAARPRAGAAARRW